MCTFSRELLQNVTVYPSEPNFGYQKALNQPKSAKINPEVAKSNPHYYKEVLIPMYDPRSVGRCLGPTMGLARASVGGVRRAETDASLEVAKLASRRAVAHRGYPSDGRRAVW